MFLLSSSWMFSSDYHLFVLSGRPIWGLYRLYTIFLIAINKWVMGQWGTANNTVVAQWRASKTMSKRDAKASCYMYVVPKRYSLGRVHIKLDVSYLCAFYWVSSVSTLLGQDQFHFRVMQGLFMVERFYFIYFIFILFYLIIQIQYKGCALIRVLWF